MQKDKAQYATVMPGAEESACISYDKRVEELLERLMAALENVINERDALLKIMKAHGNCEYCKHRIMDDYDPCEKADYVCAQCSETTCRCKECFDQNWEWRGVQEGEND